MARNRMLNPEFWLDEEIAKLTPHARLLYMGVWGICDDNHATFPDRPEWIKVQIFPYEDINMPALLKELEDANKLLNFEENGKKYWFIKNFFKYQRIDKPSDPKYPRYPLPLADYSPTTLAEVKLSKEKISKDKGSSFKKPFFKGNEMRFKEAEKKWYVIKDGQWLEYAGLQDQIEWK